MKNGELIIDDFITILRELEREVKAESKIRI